MSHPKFRHIGSPMTRLIEECAELQQALCKADRFGWFNYHPDRPDRTNMDDVKSEMDDVVEAMERMQECMRQLKHEHFSGATTKVPYPGMSEAFEVHYGQSFVDPDWRNDTSIFVVPPSGFIAPLAISHFVQLV